jgi:hypothetical protein
MAMNDTETTSDEAAVDKENYNRITTIGEAVMWKALEAGIKQLPDEGYASDMLGLVMGLIVAAIWIEEQSRNITKDKTKQMEQRKESFLQLVADLWDDHRSSR